MTRSLATQFKALSEDVRLQILALIFRHQELCVCEVERFLDISQSKASRHLRYLLNAGILEDRRDGLWVYYRMAGSDSDQQRLLLDFLCELLHNVDVPDVSDQLRVMRAERCAPDASPARLAVVTSAPRAGTR
ncbi:MAG: metalloregulator ArsR/SmtB family transcription factor [Gemmatimonadales bacterium]